MCIYVYVLKKLSNWKRNLFASVAHISVFQSEFGDFVMVTPDLGLFFPAVDYMEKKMNKMLQKEPYKYLPIAVNCIFFKGFDYTAIKVVQTLFNF